MDATPVTWTQVFARSERVAQGALRATTLARRVARVRYDGLHDLIIIQPAHDPSTGAAGPAHTRALLTLLVSASWRGDRMATTAAAVGMSATLTAIERSMVGKVDVSISRSPSGLVLALRPHDDVPERTASCLRLTLILDANPWAGERAA